MMQSEVANEAMTRTEEEVGIMIRQTRQSVERETIHGHIDGSGEEGLFIKANPVDVMVIGHD
jgi:hypothetical protein